MDVALVLHYTPYMRYLLSLLFMIKNKKHSPPKNYKNISSKIAIFCYYEISKCE